MNMNRLVFNRATEADQQAQLVFFFHRKDHLRPLDITDRNRMPRSAMPSATVRYSSRTPD
jgi:hypothetical protein